MVRFHSSPPVFLTSQSNLNLFYKSFAMVKCASRYNLIDSSTSESPTETSIDLKDPHARPISRRMHHGRLFWTEICWRLMATLVFSIAMTAVLYSFSLKGVLGRWERRWFSALAIFLSSLVSLSTGSLLGLLGSMIRWPLLARKLYTAVDVRLSSIANILLC